MASDDDESKDGEEETGGAKKTAVVDASFEDEAEGDALAPKADAPLARVESEGDDEEEEDEDDDVLSM